MRKRNEELRKDLVVVNSKAIEKKDNSIKEKWKPVIIDDTIYDTYEISNKGKIRNSKTKKGLKPFSIDERYQYISLKIDGETKLISIHRLVAMAFCKIDKKHKEKGYTFDDLVVNHKDGYKWHNYSYNLEWITQKENMDHARGTGLNSGIMGENSHLAKMDNKTVEKCCKLLEKGWATSDIAKKLNVSKKSVQHIKSGECWKEISKKYTFKRLGKAIPNTLPIESIHEICKLLEKKCYSDSEIAKQFGVSREYIRDIRLHKRRKDISCNYNF